MEGNRNLKVFVWNMQTLNIQQSNIRKIKVDFILMEINKQFPEIIYLIDVGRELKIGGNYETFFDGRNCLFVRKDCEFKVNVGYQENWMEIENIKFGFIYIIPNNYDKEVIEKRVIKWKMNKWEFAGDFNLRSNREIEKLIDWKAGEITKQTGIAGKVQTFRILNSPSDHKLITFTINRKINFSASLRVTSIKDRDIDEVDRILNFIPDTEEELKNKGLFIDGVLKGDPIIKNIPMAKYEIIYTRAIENEEELTIMKIINNYRRNKVSALYDRFGWYWRNNRKEPFIGTKIPPIVFKSFKDELRHNPEKVKRQFNEKIPQIFNEGDINEWNTDKGVRINLPKSKSKAITMEGIKLCQIGKRIIDRFEGWILGNKTENILNIAENVQKTFNLLMREGIFYSNTFFLRKKLPMESYRDVRMITVVPVLIKVWETLIYNKVLDNVNKVFGEEEIYQLGALRGASTYEALAILRAKVKKYKACAILSIDLTKGYEKVNHDFLEKAISEIGLKEDVVIYLRFWVTMVRNMDYMVNGQAIKATIGIPMGLSLSPISFVIYLHWGFKGISKEFLVSFMDDINALVLEKEMNDNYIKNILEALDNIGMVVNERKSLIFTEREIFNDRRRREVFRNISVSSSMVYLGRELTWLEEGITGENCSYIQKFDIPKVFPNWLTLAMRRLILIGGYCAKHRFITYMWAFERIDFKTKYIKAIFNFLKINFEKPNYIQIIMVYTNLFRELIDSTSWNEIGKEYEIILRDTFGDKWKNELRPLLAVPIADQFEYTARINDKITQLSAEEEYASIQMDRLTCTRKLLKYLETGIEQLDLKVGKVWNYNFYGRILLIAAVYNNDFKDAKIGLNIAWDIYLRYVINNYVIEQKRFGGKWWIYDIEKVDWNLISAHKYFGVFMDLIFGRVDLEGEREWDFWLFDELVMILDYMKGKRNFADFYGKRTLPKFLISKEDRRLRRHDTTYEIVDMEVKNEIYLAKHSFDRISESPKRRERYEKARKLQRKFRKIFFVLDSVYARKDLRDKGYYEIDVAFQLKLHTSVANLGELSKIMLIQDWEELNVYNENEEFNEDVSLIEED